MIRIVIMFVTYYDIHIHIHSGPGVIETCAGSDTLPPDQANRLWDELAVEERY